MISKFYGLLKLLVQRVLIISLAGYLLLIPFSDTALAAKTSMTGDYSKDTVSVIRDLKDVIAITENEEEKTISDKEAVFLITDYISRYRNRPQINGSLSFTTMQTALNALAGHYKTFPNRPVPEKLKDRLNDELSKAEVLLEKNR